MSDPAKKRHTEDGENESRFDQGAPLLLFASPFNQPAKQRRAPEYGRGLYNKPY
jgi:hypothetical protein